MTPPETSPAAPLTALDVGAAGIRVLDRATRNDSRGLFWFLGVIGVTAIVGGTVYLIAVRSDVQDRWTGSQQRAYMAAMDDRRTADLKANADVIEKMNKQIALLEQNNAVVNAKLDDLLRRTGRVETKLDGLK